MSEDSQYLRDLTYGPDAREEPLEHGGPDEPPHGNDCWCDACEAVHLAATTPRLNALGEPVQHAQAAQGMARDNGEQLLARRARVSARGADGA